MDTTSNVTVQELTWRKKAANFVPSNPGPCKYYSELLDKPANPTFEMCLDIQQFVDYHCKGCPNHYTGETAK